MPSRLRVARLSGVFFFSGLDATFGAPNPFKTRVTVQHMPDCAQLEHESGAASLGQ